MAHAEDVQAPGGQDGAVTSRRHPLFVLSLAFSPSVHAITMWLREVYVGLLELAFTAFWVTSELTRGRVLERVLEQLTKILRNQSG